MVALIDLRRRIKSVRNTQQITKAMKTVSTAKFKKSQRVVIETRPYLHSYPDLLAQVALWAGKQGHPLLMRRDEKKVEGVVITSDKGLCGAFNSNLLAKTLSFFENKSRHAQVKLVLIGKKASNFFKRNSFPIDMIYSDKTDRITQDDMKEIANFLMRLYIFNKTDAIYLAYNEFKSILTPQITITKLLPICPSDKDERLTTLLPDWDPEIDLILNSLLSFYVENQIYHCFYESSASEHAARMMAMDNATQNAEDLISSLVLLLNKIRQASITKELLEIMSAVEALAK